MEIKNRLKIGTPVWLGLGLVRKRYGQRNGIHLTPVTRALRFIITVDREDVPRMGGTIYPTFYRNYAKKEKGNISTLTQTGTRVSSALTQKGK